MNYQHFTQQLRDSTMFHMSLGSKELFHSNFLHWISIVNWDAFLQIMHKLAGLAEDEKFWWEDKHSPEKGNVEVRREFHNFDLSIYILDSESKIAVDDHDDKKENQDKEYAQKDGSRMVQKWIPVLVLENKMKSLPYEEQLENYTKKAYEEWRKGAKAVNEIKKLKVDFGQNKEMIWQTKHGITFILLSLITANQKLGNNIEQTFEFQRQKEKKTIKISFKWIHKTYNDLLIGIRGCQNCFKGKLDKPIIDDYCRFVKALDNLANKNWVVVQKNCYRSQIFPWKVDIDKTNEINEYMQLRIHDIHEKVLYDQLLSMAEDMLTNNSIKYKRFNAKTIQTDFSNGFRIFTNSAYAHGIGIFEVQYFITYDVRLIIQVQGDRYCHMVFCKEEEIVKEEKNKQKKTILKVNDNLLKETNDIVQGLDYFLSILGNKQNRFPEIKAKEPDLNDYHKYGSNLIYQYVEIKNDATVDTVINAIIGELKAIKSRYEK